MDSSDLSKRMFLDCLSPRCGAALAMAFAEVLADGLDSNQLDALGSFFNIVGDNLSYMASQIELNEAKCKKKNAQSSDDDSDSDTESDNAESDNTQSDNNANKHTTTDKNSGGAQPGQGRNGEAVVT